MTQEDQGKAGWNFSQQITQQGANLLYGAQQDYLDAKYQRCFLKTREMRLLIEPFLNPDDFSKLDKIEKRINFYWREQDKAKKAIEYVIFGEGQKARHRLHKARSNHHALVFQYRQLMASAISKSGFGVGKREDQTKMF